ncbi:hypothetical protein WN51_03056 [Melipona quadrifasciata]|uniref:Uncharacterized protein n=1 Tax=Melipona quadrifasciata TaxID=166423 RepID=A0A0N0BEH9_9HYME|nr:hypothetical protein WN51_03056 [Melipona quadrifasciata]
MDFRKVLKACERLLSFEGAEINAEFYRGCSFTNSDATKLCELTLYQRPSSSSEDDELWTNDFAKFGESAPAESAVVSLNANPSRNTAFDVYSESTPGLWKQL